MIAPSRRQFVQTALATAAVDAAGVHGADSSGEMVADAQALATHAMRGAVFESWVVAETLKHRLNQGLAPDLYFWRDNHGTELDLLYPDGEHLYPVEIKSGQTFSPDWTKGLDKFKRYAGDRVGHTCVVYGGSDDFEFFGHSVRTWRLFDGSRC